MAVSNIEEMFVHDLEDIYYAENELVDALDELAEQTDNENAREAFEEHRAETEGQIDRLEEVFTQLDMEPDVEECEGIEGLIEEHDTFVSEEDPEQEVLNLHNLVAAQKTEHYEIAAYENLMEVAEEMEMNDTCDLLEANLEEEQAALEKVSSLVDKYDFDAEMDQASD